ncbi:hypothetical protein EJ08DRAFT_31223 [Tothia fuscella]|uniref:Transcription factor domain-containing protein n=1 Tax=Tothia fuscella TaxID=1048955 RepID=A0A9P4TTC6_9PEZI|nr:hypothetical protein EJ08DRAFT_31223 [Tothia fuscella]
MDFTDPVLPETFTESSYMSTSLISAPTPWTKQTAPADREMYFSDFSIPTIPSSNVRSLIPRPKLRTGAALRTANLILSTLKSYPFMMMRHNSLPPFIHPQMLFSQGESLQVEPLTNCISLVNMISSGIQGSRKLFWKNVRLECERLFGDHWKLDRWELLGAMQALSIYMLIRLSEGETEHNNVDHILLATVTVIGQFFGQYLITCDLETALCNSSVQSNWREWVFEESRRRLSVVYRVVNMLVYYYPAALCELQTDLLIAPLPARKQLWEASNESTWKAERKGNPAEAITYALASSGELVKLDEGQLHCSNGVLTYISLDETLETRTSTNWEEWCSGMDGFGGLIMLAASLIH